MDFQTLADKIDAAKQGLRPAFVVIYNPRRTEEDGLAAVEVVTKATVEGYTAYGWKLADVTEVKPKNVKDRGKSDK